MLPIIEQYETLAAHSPILAAAAVFVGLTLAAFVVNWVMKKILLRAYTHLIGRARRRDGEAARNSMVHRLANIVPALVFMAGIRFIPDLPDLFVKVVGNVTLSFIVVMLSLAASAGLAILNIFYMRRPGAADHPIKGYLQVVRIAIFFVATIIVVSTLVDKSPVILLSGLGALAAVLMLVFQDTLLSLVASIQISSNDMVRVGDWIEMPQLNADGFVIDMALHTVKVQNWDKTITTLPMKRLITDPFKNWRGMFESGGRRIKRAMYIDQTSIHFLTEEERAHLYKFNLLRDYLDNKTQEIDDWNSQLAAQGLEIMNMRRITNIGTFRAYVQAYLNSHPGINQDMLLLARQLGPGENGLPIEIYAFTKDVRWAFYEGVQADIFDHLYAILPEFGLKPFQHPTGADLRGLTRGP